MKKLLLSAFVGFPKSWPFKIKILLNIILLLSPFISFAQTEVKIGEPYKTVDIQNTYLYDNGIILAVKVDGNTKLTGNNFFIQNFNANTLSLLKSNIYNTKTEEMQLRSDLNRLGDQNFKLKKINNKFYLIYNYWDKKFYREIDINNAAFKGEKKELFSIDQFEGSGYGVRYSMDDSKIMCVYGLSSDKNPKNLNQTGFTIIGNGFEKLWEYVLDIPYVEKVCGYKDFLVDKDGNFYLLSLIYEDEKKDLIKNGVANYHYEVLFIDKITKTVKKNSIMLGKLFSHDVHLRETSDGSVYGIGHTNNGVKESDEKFFQTGIFKFKIDQQGLVSEIKNYNFPNEIQNQYTAEKKPEIHKLNNLEVNDFEVEKDGSLILVEEVSPNGIRNTSTMGFSTAGGVSVSTINETCLDILVSRINPLGELAWVKRLPKRQLRIIGDLTAGGLSAISYKLINDIDTYTMIFFDDLKNENLASGKWPAQYMNKHQANLTSYRVNKISGETEKKIIFKTATVDKRSIYLYSPLRMLQTSSDEVVMEVLSGSKKEDILIKVKLK